MANERLYQFPSKASPVPADILFAGDSANSFDEVQLTIAAVIGAYPALLSIGGLTTGANNLIYTTAANTYAVISSVNNAVLISGNTGIPSLSNTLPSAVQANITTLGTQAQALNMGNFAINNVANPVNAQDAATKTYVDSIATGGGAPCYCATTANLTVTQSGAGVGATLTNAGAQAAFSVDGQTPSVGARVLVKNQSTQSQNGVYTLTNAGSVSTNWVLTRAVDYDTPADINDTGTIPVINGSANANTAWYNTTTMVTVDTTAVTFVQFGNAGTVTSVSGAGLATGTVTSSGSITVTAAVKTDQTTGTSTSVAVVPGVQQYHASATKGWVNFNWNGSAIVVNASYNVSSVTRAGTGSYTVNWTTSFTSAFYATTATPSQSASTTIAVIVPTPSASAVSFNCWVAFTGSAVDPAQVNVCSHGTQ